MSEEERLIQGDDVAANGSDPALLVIILFPPAGTSNHNVVTNIPVRSGINSNLSGTNLSSVCEVSPNDILRGTMHVQCAESAANHLVTIEWERRTESGGVHGNLHTRGIRELFCTNLEVPIVNENEVGIKCSQVVGISIWREDHTSHNEESSKFISGVGVH